MKRIVLTLEYDLGDYQDMFNDCARDGQPVGLEPEDWADSFYQSDVVIGDIKIIGVRVETESPDA